MRDAVVIEADFILYGTLGCHLCEEAERLVAALPEIARWRIELVDIADEDALIERYGIRIPVLRAMRDDAELGWPFDATAASAWLHQHG